MKEMHKVKVICPLAYFEISRDLRKEIGQGIELIENVRLRRISKEEIKEVRKRKIRDMVPRVFSKFTSRSIVVEISNIEDDPESEEWERKVNNILLALRLFKANQIFIRVTWFENSETQCVSWSDASVPFLVTERYSLEKKEIADLRELVKRVDAIDFDKDTSLRIVCERFGRSYEKEDWDEIIIDLMIAFEALFLRGTNPNLNLSHTGLFIGLGCSMLVGMNNEERKNIGEFIVEAYKKRNKIVHGSDFKTSFHVDSRVYEIEDFVVKLRDYLRQSMKKLI